MNSHESSKRAFQSLSIGAKSLWAKASGDNCEESWLPLIIHMTDSAKVARLLWHDWIPYSTKKLIVDGMTGLKDNRNPFESGEKLLIFLAAAHDLGKATPAFQYSPALRLMKDSFAQERRGAIEAAGLSVRDDLQTPTRIHHSLASEMILELRGFDRSMAIVLGGHHGKPPSDSDVLDYHSYPNHTGINNKPWCNVQDELLDYAAGLSGFDIAELRSIKNSITNQVILTGLVIMSDWIASDETLFPYIKEPYCAESDFYNRAEHAWSELNLPRRWEVSDYWKSNDLLQFRFNIPARPIQQAVEQAAKEMEEPGIFLIEAPMGEGKTEAALVAAEIFAEKFGMGGLFFALPTQATADGIFTRMKKWIDDISTETDEDRSLFLAHGKSAFNKEYQSIRKNTYHVYDLNNDGLATGNVIVHEWFDGRKKGLLSDFVIGTVDQVLMAGLKRKHLAMRHLALANKVLIIDEVHAYDAYMSSYLAKALQWLGSYKIPVILLSATLSQKNRRDLIDAYLNNKSKHEYETDTEEQWTSNSSYPLITYTAKKTVKQITTETSGRNLAVKITCTTEEVLFDIIEDFTDGGGYVGIIVNTVQKAQKIKKALAEKYGDENTFLLHSRFVSIERTMREKEVRDMLSSNRKSPPHRVFVVGTQVMEQSLDLDFDLLITDLCPMDLLLQRIGRLHRHDNIRPEKLKEARCIVLDTDDGSFDGGSEAIYQKYHLMNTRYLLPETIFLPDDIYNLVQSAYDPDGVVMSHDLEREYCDAKEKMNNFLIKKEEKAKTFQIKEPKPGIYGLIGWLDRSRSDDGSDKAGEATVRDTDGSIEVIIIQEYVGHFFLLPLNDNMGGMEIPTAETPDSMMCFTLAGCRVALPHSFSTTWQLERTIKELETDNIHRLPNCWQESSWLAGELFLILDENNTAVLSGKKLIYDRELGLRMEEME